MHHHFSRLLTRRLLLPAASSPYAAALSTLPRRTYAVAPPPTPTAAVDSEAKATWQREKLPGELLRPPTIPFQPRVANSVHLVGTVCAPVHMQRLPDGRFSAVSVLVHDRGINLPKFYWKDGVGLLPNIAVFFLVVVVSLTNGTTVQSGLICKRRSEPPDPLDHDLTGFHSFQNDLAQLSAYHLKVNDLVYVSGKLTCDSPPFKLADGEANIHALANLLQLVDRKAAETDAILDEDEGFLEIVEAEKKVEEKKPTYKFPPATVSGYMNKADKLNNLWNDVISRPQDWIDNQPLKKTGSRSPKYPDFKNKVSVEALWLDTAPRHQFLKSWMIWCLAVVMPQKEKTNRSAMIPKKRTCGEILCTIQQTGGTYN